MSEHTLRRIDDAIQGIVSAGLARAAEILRTYRATLDRGANALLEHETLDESALKDLQAELRALAQPA